MTSSGLETPGAARGDDRLRARAQALLAPLDEEQRAAATADGPVLVVAPAGSGKTRVLAHRLAHLCTARKVSPRRLLVLVGHERAADDVRARAERLLVFPLHGAWIGTFHAICQRILRAHAAAVGRKSTFAILDETDARTLVRRAGREAGADADRYPAWRLQELIADAKTRRIVPEGVVGEVFRVYERLLAEANAFDANDLLRYVLRLLEEDEALRVKYRRRFEYLLVDDFQDLTPPRRALIARLAAPAGNVLAVGDPNQALAPGAPPPLDALRADFPEALQIELRHGYRSTRRISYVARRVIRHNPGTHPELDVMRRRGARVVALTAGDEMEEAQTVVAVIQRLVRRGEAKLERIGVLYRQPIQARPLEEALVRAGVPYHVVGGLRFYERREIKDVLAYLRLTVGGGDPAALARIANVPRRGIGPASVATIARLQRSSRITMAEAAMRAASLPRVTAQRAGALADLGRMLADLDDAARQRTCAELIDYVVERTGYGNHLADLSRSEEETRREGIDELRGLARAFPGHAVEALPQFFERVALVSGAPWIAAPVWPRAAAGDGEPAPRRRRDLGFDDEVDPDATFEPPRGDGGVQLLTYAGTKGHEFDVVLVTGMEEGILPGARAIQAGDAAVEAERRLCYLAMTRARDRLFLTRALGRTLLGQARAGGPSRFLHEAGRRVRRFRVGAARRLLLAQAPAAGAAPGAPAEGLLVVREGQRVIHPTYGSGIVTRVEPGAKIMIAVRFDAAPQGEKRLALAYARLQPA